MAISPKDALILQEHLYEHDIALRQTQGWLARAREGRLRAVLGAFQATLQRHAG